MEEQRQDAQTLCARKQDERNVEEFEQLTDMAPFPVRALIIIAIAAAVAVGLYFVLPYAPTTNKGLALLAFIAIMWLTEAVHITITALMVPVLAVFIGVGKIAEDGSLEKAITIKQTLANFASDTIYVFFGGFALAAALHVQQLDKKIAMKLISMAKGNLGVAAILICIVTALLSMWVSNTATAAMMLPLALGIIASMKEQDRATMVFILLGIAYSASIGGLGTIVGSPPNAIASKELGFTFADWMKLGLPFMLILLPVMLVIMYFVFKPKLNQKVEVEIVEIPWTRDRILTAILFTITALLWICSKPINDNILKPMDLGFRLSDAWVAIAAAICIVTGGLAKWQEVSENTEWGVLLLFGGGLALSAILKDSGASLVLGKSVAGLVSGLPAFVIIFVVAIFIIALTEFTSNTASAALLVPVFAAIAAETGLPKETLTIVIGIGASCAFVMPVATPPNALVFGTGKIKQSEMVKVGLILACVSALLLAIYTYIFYA